MFGSVTVRILYFGTLRLSRENLDFANSQLGEMGIKLSLSKVKWPVMDKLKRRLFLANLTGDGYLPQNGAFSAIRDLDGGADMSDKA